MLKCICYNMDCR